MNIKLLKKKNLILLIHSAIVLGISYLIVSGFTLNTKSLSFFSVLYETGDLTMSDKYINSTTKYEPNITLISTDSFIDRTEIAKVIEQIDSLNPKVIGLDVGFYDLRDAKSDSILENAVCKSKNLVVACKLKNRRDKNSDIYKTCEHSFFVKEKHNFIEGFVNAGDDANGPIRTFAPQLFLQQENFLDTDTIYNFAVQVVRLYNDSLFQELLKRRIKHESINYHRLHFYNLFNKNEIENNRDQITDKIVLMGTFKRDFHKTPAVLQMNGIEINAYIISTILDGKYIDRLDNVWTKLMNFLFCYLFASFCWIATTKFKKGVHILIKLAQVAVLFFVFFIGRYLFNHFNIDIDYTRTIGIMGVIILIVDLYHVCVDVVIGFFKRKKIILK